MKAPFHQQLQLLELQRLDTAQVRLQRKLEQSPVHQQLADLAQQVQATKSGYLAARREIEETQLEQQHLAEDLAVVTERLHRDEAKLAESSDAKVATALGHEIETIQRRQRNIEEMQFEVATRLEEQEEQCAVLERALEAHEAAQQALLEQREQLNTEVTAELNALANERAEIVAQLNAELVELFERTRDRYGIGAAALRGGISEGSNMALDEANLTEIRETDLDEIIFCSDSGCILVRVDEADRA